jgi:hypothetical protein
MGLKEEQVLFSLIFTYFFGEGNRRLRGLQQKIKTADGADVDG